MYAYIRKKRAIIIILYIIIRISNTVLYHQNVNRDYSLFVVAREGREAIHVCGFKKIVLSHCLFTSETCVQFWKTNIRIHTALVKIECLIVRMYGK